MWASGLGVRLVWASGLGVRLVWASGLGVRLVPIFRKVAWFAIFA